MGRHTKAKANTIILNGREVARSSAVAHAKAPLLPNTSCAPSASTQLSAAGLGPRRGHGPVVIGMRGTKKATRLVPSRLPSKQGKRVPVST